MYPVVPSAWFKWDRHVKHSVSWFSCKLYYKLTVLLPYLAWNQTVTGPLSKFGHCEQTSLVHRSRSGGIAYAKYEMAVWHKNSLNFKQKAVVLILESLLNGSFSWTVLQALTCINCCVQDLSPVQTEKFLVRDKIGDTSRERKKPSSHRLAWGQFS